MKQILIIAMLLISLSAFAQKKDSTKQVQVVITLDTTSYKQLLYVIDTSIDSKQTTKALIELLQKNARLMEADKPKPQPQLKKN